MTTPTIVETETRQQGLLEAPM